MLVVGFPTGAFQANCYLLAEAAGDECVIVDPGQDAEGPIDEALLEHRLTPSAVLATHGHFDHVFAAKSVADTQGIPVYIHPDDRDLLSDPLKGLGPDLAAAFGDLAEMAEPAQVRELDGSPLHLAGLDLDVLPTPGHTPGSVVYRLDTPEGGRVALTGDTLFAGSIGRTDLPGGDPAKIAESLRDKVMTLPDDTVVLPGHGQASTIGQERSANPFLIGVG